MSIMKTLTINGTTYNITPVVPAASVTLLASAWVGDGEAYSQVVSVPEATPYTKVDLLPSSEQLAEFHHKVLAFVAENNGGVVTVYAIGDKPTGDYTIQITKTEVQGTGMIRGNTVGTPTPRPDWNQTDPTKADYIKNKPDLPGSSSDGATVYATEIRFKNTYGQDIAVGPTSNTGTVTTLEFADFRFQDVILRGIAPGEQDTDAVNVAQLNDAIASVGGGSGGVSTMIVRMQDEDYADETAEVINQHISRGGLAYFCDDDYYYPLAADVANGVSIGLIQTYGEKFRYVEIDVDGTVTYNESDYSDLAGNLSGVAKDVLALMQQMGDIDTALDNIIAIQNSLIGGEA